jgi:isoquinoline 1-oxidoreductase beta subunit
LSWRATGHSQNVFAFEGFIDEMAHAAGQDPLAFRRRMLEHRPDVLAVIDLLAEKGDWARPLPPGSGRGVAVHEAYGTICCQIVEATVGQDGTVRCDRVVAVLDCGHVINPRGVETQVESGIVFGLTAALYGEITIKDGAVEQGNFDSYKMIRLAGCPKIETYLALSGGDKWGGVGELSTPPVAAALCNAIFAATGKRIRALPIGKIDPAKPI